MPAAQPVPRPVPQAAPKRRRRAAAAVLGVAAVGTAAVLAVGPASAGTGAAGAGSRVTMSGTGAVVTKPDLLVVRLGVEHYAADVSTALSRANASVRRVRDALRAGGVADPDIRTTSLRVDRWGAKDKRYRAFQSISASLRDVDRAGGTISAAAEAGGDAIRIDDVDFTMADRAPLLEKARGEAFAEAHAKAKHHAAMTGRTLGPVVSVREGVSYPTVVAGEGAAADTAAASAGGAVLQSPAAAAAPLSRGRESTEVHATVVWELR